MGCAGRKKPLEIGSSKGSCEGCNAPMKIAIRQTADFISDMF